jgi:hypothetical protein
VKSNKSGLKLLLFLMKIISCASQPTAEEMPYNASLINSFWFYNLFLLPLDYPVFGTLEAVCPITRLNAQTLGNKAKFIPISGLRFGTRLKILQRIMSASS